jgi:hypothetical protein
MTTALPPQNRMRLATPLLSATHEIDQALGFGRRTSRRSPRLMPLSRVRAGLAAPPFFRTS